MSDRIGRSSAQANPFIPQYPGFRPLRIGSGAAARIKIEFTAYGEKEFALSVVPIVKLED